MDFEECPTLIEFIKIQEKLEDLLGIEIDLLTEEGISPFIRPFIREVIEV